MKSITQTCQLSDRELKAVLRGEGDFELRVLGGGRVPGEGPGNRGVHHMRDTEVQRGAGTSARKWGSKSRVDGLSSCPVTGRKG